VQRGLTTSDRTVATTVQIGAELEKKVEISLQLFTSGSERASIRMTAAPPLNFGAASSIFAVPIAGRCLDLLAKLLRQATSPEHLGATTEEAAAA
jgi:hypothetical protein